MPQPIRYVSQAHVADYLSVSRAAVGNWRNRYPDEIPQPDALVDDSLPLWKQNRLEEWLEWYRARITARYPSLQIKEPEA